MENKINIAELLKDCPKGMELDCVLFDNVKFEECTEECIYIRLNNGELFALTKYGNCLEFAISKCIIYPKNKTTWEGFVPTCQFKNGDVIYNQCIQAVAIFYKQTDDSTISHCFQNKWKELELYHHHCRLLSGWRLAPEEKKEELFQAIKENGYRWDEETKKLEKVSQYPQTFEECCTVLGLTELGIIGGYRHGLLTQFRNLLICRDAYWKIADDWKFNFEEKCYYLCNEYHEIQDFNGVCDCNAVLAFPTAEMRDAFYDNFEELIKECKSLL